MKKRFTRTARGFVIGTALLWTIGTLFAGTPRVKTVENGLVTSFCNAVARVITWWRGQR
jgi:hypothetical protein